MTREEFDNNCELLIIGGGDDKYERFLREEVARLKLRNVRFTGFLSGEEKDRAIASCSVIANPSDFENLGMVILEGLVRGIPCIATTGSPWENLIKHQCGWWVPASRRMKVQALHFHSHRAFRRQRNRNDRRTPLNKAYFEVISVSFAKMDKLNRDRLLQKRDLLLDNMYCAMNSSRSYCNSHSGGTADRSAVRTRFSWMEQILEHTLNNNRIRINDNKIEVD